MKRNFHKPNSSRASSLLSTENSPIRATRECQRVVQERHELVKVGSYILLMTSLGDEDSKQISHKEPWLRIEASLLRWQYIKPYPTVALPHPSIRRPLFIVRWCKQVDGTHFFLLFSPAWALSKTHLFYGLETLLFFSSTASVLLPLPSKYISQTFISKEHKRETFFFEAACWAFSF